MKKNFVRFETLFLVCLACSSTLFAEGPEAVKYGVVENYFLKNTIQPAEGENTVFGIIHTSTDFNVHFGPAAVMWRNQKFLPKNFFESHALLFFAEWGNTPWQYEIQSVTRENSVLKVRYTRTGEPSPLATFSPSLLVSVPKNVAETEVTVLFERVENQK